LISKTKNKRFSFEGAIPFSQEVQLIYSNFSYVSGSFVIEKGIQSIICNVDSNRKVPEVRNKVMGEYNTD